MSIETFPPVTIIRFNKLPTIAIKFNEANSINQTLQVQTEFHTIYETEHRATICKNPPANEQSSLVIFDGAVNRPSLKQKNNNLLPKLPLYYNVSTSTDAPQNKVNHPETLTLLEVPKNYPPIDPALWPYCLIMTRSQLELNEKAFVTNYDFFFLRWV
ncbi:unnamed protein product [Colias eurytheme]|nr:unnamed protein product [Colias eurytheme]